VGLIRGEEQLLSSDWVYKEERTQQSQEGVERGERAALEADLRISEDLTPNTCVVFRSGQPIT
jgi:hypothetical protein